jgi:hypothetical protein
MKLPFPMFVCLALLAPLLGCLPSSSPPGPQTAPVAPTILAAPAGPLFNFGYWRLPVADLLSAPSPQDLFVLLDGTWTDAAGQATTFAEYLPVDSLAADASALLVPVDPQLFPGGGSPGTFKGQVSALLWADDQLLSGPSVPCAFRSGAAFQVVYLRPVQDFALALQRFGLAAGQDTILNLLPALADAYFQGYAVSFRAQPPGDFYRFMRVDLLGRDPSGLGLLGLDATPGKDQGNLIPDEILGGFSRPARRDQQVPWGGIFLESFLAFSPTSASAGALADPVFDDLFAAFSPELGGQPLRAADLHPDAPRYAAAQLALRTLAQLLASTVAHETGHCLGLAQVAGAPDAPHHLEDLPRHLMDEGRFRPFAERAALDGEIEILSRLERQYLQAILPLPEEVSQP